MLKGFRDFIARGNAVDLAVGRLDMAEAQRAAGLSPGVADHRQRHRAGKNHGAAAQARLLGHGLSLPRAGFPGLQAVSMASLTVA